MVEIEAKLDKVREGPGGTEGSVQLTRGHQYKHKCVFMRSTWAWLSLAFIPVLVHMLHTHLCLCGFLSPRQGGESWGRQGQLLEGCASE